ncbi:RodZ family helix-turn-helix domain-containing protein [Acidithiobacillus ferriphilus]|uniref:hypothetical protein n=1 Tax=Acidithiobacillus ferriphilus TaxID=1689834 RepID=UPI002DBF4870|nr:hypothetical protein [Acidithiobacillus ferriphilus]MEB8536576.1 hypothetical protein [Acidithiobacillus ferriphilus]
MNTLRGAVIMALFGLLPLTSAIAATSTASSAALANDAGVSQAELQAGNSWFNSDQNSNGTQNSSQLQTGNTLGGQSQVQGSLASSQQAAATDNVLAQEMARYYSLYTSYYNNYLTDESLASGASSTYAACVAALKTDCLNKSSYYGQQAGTAYDEYQNDYGLWYQDWQQQQAMESTAGQQSVLGGASSQASANSNNNYQNEQNTAQSDAQSSASNTKSANTGNNSAATASGQSAASTALQTIQNETGVQQGQSAPTATAPAVSSTPFSYTSPLQTQMTNDETSAMENAATDVVQQQYADNRAADATTADQQSAADTAAADVAPSAGTQAMWADGANIASNTANTYQQDANNTAATATAAQQTFVQDQNQANADAITIGEQTDVAAEAYAQKQAAANGVTYTAPTAPDTSVQSAIATDQATINQDTVTAETEAADAYSQERVATDANATATTATQQAQTDQANAQSAPDTALQNTWNAAASSESNSSTLSTQAAQAASSAEATDETAANAAMAAAETAGGKSGMDSAAINQGDSAAQAALQAIQKATGVTQSANG